MVLAEHEIDHRALHRRGRLRVVVFDLQHSRDVLLELGLGVEGEEEEGGGGGGGERGVSGAGVPGRVEALRAHVHVIHLLRQALGGVPAA